VRAVKNAKTTYINQLDKVESIIRTDSFSNNTAYENKLKTEKEKLQTYYNNFITELEKALKEKEVLAE
jgi:ribosome recycling factor